MFTIRKEFHFCASHVLDDTLPATFVPNRNTIFLSVAHAYAQKVSAQHVVTGVGFTNYSGYPDCRPGFIKQLQLTLNMGSESSIMIHTPLMYLSKADTFALAHRMGVLRDIIETTMTCYNGSDKTNDWGLGCGECDACTLRKAGYEEFVERGRA